jgi:hypothetical protein
MVVGSSRMAERVSENDLGDDIVRRGGAKAEAKSKQNRRDKKTAGVEGTSRRPLNMRLEPLGTTEFLGPWCRSHDGGAGPSEE